MGQVNTALRTSTWSAPTGGASTKTASEAPPTPNLVMTFGEKFTSRLLGECLTENGLDLNKLGVQGTLELFRMGFSEVEEIAAHMLWKQGQRESTPSDREAASLPLVATEELATDERFARHIDALDTKAFVVLPGLSETKRQGLFDHNWDAGLHHHAAAFQRLPSGFTLAEVFSVHRNAMKQTHGFKIGERVGFRSGDVSAELKVLGHKGTHVECVTDQRIDLPKNPRPDGLEPRFVRREGNKLVYEIPGDELQTRDHHYHNTRRY
jgi:hypothetical protein